jgi:Phytanoyl-CoA dioxygenase (PhyH)
MAGLDRVEARPLSAPIRVAPLVETRPRSGDPDALRHEADQQGYLFLRGLLLPDDVLALRARVLEACREIGWLDEAAPAADGVVRRGARLGAYDDAWTDLQCRVLPSPEFARLREHPAVIGILADIYRGEVVSGRGDTCRVFSPGCPELTTLPHQDHHYVRGDPALWTVWVPLGDCPRALGGLAVLPASHRTGLWPHAEEGSGRQGVDVGPDVVWAGADYRCGDVLMFNGLTVHRALENRTVDRLRISADFRYEPLGGPDAEDRGGCGRGGHR